MFLVPFGAAALFDMVVPLFGAELRSTDVTTLRAGFGLIAQGAAMVGFTWRRVTGERGLGLSREFLGIPGPGQSHLWRHESVVGLVAGIGLIALNIVGSWLTQQLFGLFMDPDQLAEYVSRETGSVADALGGGASGWIVFLLPVIAVVVAPISEELFFRGYLYGVLRSRFVGDPWYAAYWSSAVFALVHFYFVHMLPVFLIGLALTYLYRLRRSLIAPIIAHGTSNFIVTVATLISSS